MSYQVQFTDKALQGIEKLKTLLEELTIHPYSGTGQPEQLKHDFAGFWSRRINREHRIVYAVDEKIITVTVISVIGHYK